MSDHSTSRVKGWSPPQRPEWVRRINEEGRCLDLKSVVPLDARPLIERACLNTGLENFGTDDWRLPFEVLTKALDKEAQLTLIGRLMTRSDLLMNLEARLAIEETYRRHPSIDEEKISAPILIVGSGRSGTSAILNVLSLDQDNGTVKHWEALFPAPPPERSTYRSDARIKVAHQRMDQWNRVTPEIVTMHEFGGEMPTELIQLEALAFQSNGWLDLYGFVPSFDASLTPQNHLNALHYAKRVLKLLQWKNPHRRWVLKSPDCMRYLPQVFEVFPDLQLVWMHRDPIKCVASFVSLIGTLFWIRSDQRLSEQAIGQLTNPAHLASHFDLVMQQIDSRVVPAGALHNVQYLDFVRDPLATIESLYMSLGIKLTAAARAAISGYLHMHPRESRPAHRYSSGDPEKTAAERKLFDRYQTRFGVASEL